MSDLGRSIIAIGIILIFIGLMMSIAGKIPGVGRLPGDIMIKKENFSFYFPITTCILISVILSAIMFFIGKK